MIHAVIEETFSSDLETVWRIVTDNSQYSWRSDITKIEINAAGRGFTEYAPKNIPTKFVITAKEPMSYYAFSLQNKYISGTWEGRFSASEAGTHVVFTEDITVKRFLMRFFAAGYLHKQQAQYIADLKKALAEEK